MGHFSSTFHTKVEAGKVGVQPEYMDKRCQRQAVLSPALRVKAHITWTAEVIGRSLARHATRTKALVIADVVSGDSLLTVHSNCSEAVCLVARTFTTSVIFVKYREVPTRTILPNFIGNCRDSVVFAF